MGHNVMEDEVIFELELMAVAMPSQKHNSCQMNDCEWELLDLDIKLVGSQIILTQSLILTLNTA